MMVSKRNLLFQGLLFRFHVKFQGCRPLDVTRSRCAIPSENGRESDMNKSFGHGDF